MVSGNFSAKKIRQDKVAHCCRLVRTLPLPSPHFVRSFSFLRRKPAKGAGKERVRQKERTPAVPVGLLRTVFRLNGRKLAALRQPAVLNACPPSSASRPPVNAGNHAASSHTNATVQLRMAAPKRRGVKRRVRFCVKNGRLSERSEFPAV